MLRASMGSEGLRRLRFSMLCRELSEREKCFEATVVCSGTCKVAGGQSAWMD